MPADCETNRVYATFRECWLDELKKAEATTVTSTTEAGSEASRSLLHPKAYQPSLIKALARAFGTDFLRAGLVKLIFDVSMFVGPQVLNHLIQFLRNLDAPLSQGVGLTLLVTLSQIVMSISYRVYYYKCRACGLRIRTAVMIAVYQKSLLLSLKERHGGGSGGLGGPGEIVNLVGIDAERMQELMTHLHAVWYSFFQIGLAMYFLWGQVGPSCLAGVVVIVVMMPVTKFIAGWLSGIQKILMKARDERVALNNELLGAMKVSSISFSAS